MMPPKKKVQEPYEDMESDVSDFEMEDEPVRTKKAPPKKVKNSPKKKAGAGISDATTSKKNYQEENMGNLEDPQQWAGVYDDEDLLSLEVPPPPQPCMESDGTGARLVIKEIIATNFKSYYGSQRIGPFHKNFTAIIGPNGSGKSNVIDSLLFVFGFRAQKIRLTNLAELIHNSSNKERPRFCTVEVRFHKIIDMPNGEFESVPGSTFSVSRTAYIEGGSQYQIDGKVKTVKEVVKKLRDVGIDLIHNRFLILQGEVESIAMMKPVRDGKEEGMLEYLEDIIGSSRFKEPIERIGKKLEYLSVQRSQQTQKVSMVDKERVAMEGPVQEMIAHLRTENNITSIKNKISHMKMYKIEDTIEVLKPEAEKLSFEKEGLDKQLAEVMEKKKAHESEFQEFDDQKVQLDSRLKLITNKLTDAAAAESKRKLDFKRCTKDLATLRAKLVKETEQMKHIMEIPERAKGQCDILSGMITSTEEKIRELEEKIDDNRPKFEKKSETLRTEKTVAEEELGKRQAVVDSASSNLTIAKEELQAVIAEEEKAKKRLSDLQTQIDQARSECETKTKDQGETKGKVAEYEVELNNTRDTIPKIKEKLDHLKKEISALTSLIANDQELLSENSNSGDRVTTFLEKARADGNLDGYMGRLCDLAATDAKYDAAFSTTCGTYLASYLVRSKEDANEAITLIRNAGLPRTNFRILNEVPEDSALMNQPPSKFPLPRLFDQLRIAMPEIKKIYYQSVRDSLIVDNMNTARDLARKHGGIYRYVDLNGGVLDQNNTVSGGGRPRKGLITIGNVKPNNADEVQAAQKRMDGNIRQQAELQRQINEVDASHRKLEEMLFTVSRNFNGARNHLQSLNNDINVLKDRIANLEKQRTFQQEQSRKIKVDAALVNEKKTNVDKLANERDVAKELYDKCKKSVDDVSSRLNEMWNTLCGCFASEKDAEMKNLQDHRAKLAKEKSSLDTFERQKTKAQSKLDSLEKDIDSKEKQEASLVKSEESMEKEIHDLEDEKNRIAEDIQLVEVKRKDARSKNSHLDDEEMKAISALKDLTEKLENLRNELQAFEAELKGVKRTIAGYRLHRIKDVASLPTSILKPRLHDFMVDDETAEEEAEYNRKQAEREKSKKRKDRGHERERNNGNEENEDGSADDGENGSDEEGGANDASNDDGILKPITTESLATINKEDLKFQLKVAEERIASNKKDINMGIIEEYAEKVARYNEEYSSLQSVKKVYSDHLAKQEKLKRERAEEFMKGFTDIGGKLKSMYQMITLGGDAALDIKDTMNPFLEGVQFMVRPPKKSWKNIQNLSGGEKTLSSLALVFALHAFRPTPLYVMDEIDAALDFRNVSIIGHYIKDKTKNAQFIVISLRNNMFELGDRLIGIYKTFDCTKNAVIDPKRIVKEKERITAAMDAVGKKALRDELLSKSNRAEGDRPAAKVSRETLEELPLQSLHNLHLERKRVSSHSDDSSSAKRIDDRSSPVARGSGKSRIQ